MKPCVAREKILEVIGRPGGICTADVKHDPFAVRRELSNLVSKGLIFKAAISHKIVRYFDTPRKARECLRTTPPPKLRYALKPGKAPAWDRDAPMVFTKDTIYTIAPKPPDPTRSNTFGVFG